MKKTLNYITASQLANNCFEMFQKLLTIDVEPEDDNEPLIIKQSHSGFNYPNLCHADLTFKDFHDKFIVKAVNNLIDEINSQHQQIKQSTGKDVSLFFRDLKLPNGFNGADIVKHDGISLRIITEYDAKLDEMIV